MPQMSGTAAIGVREVWTASGTLDVFGTPEGADALAVADAARTRSSLVIHIARDAGRAAAMTEALHFFAPEIPLVEFPAWDCLPYDRVSPSATTVSQRMAALSLLASSQTGSPLICVTTINAATQRTPPKEVIAETRFSAHPSESISLDKLTAYLVANGYARASTVREAGDFAVRGGLIDIFPPGAAEPMRLDFFGDQLESIRAFDPATQMTTRQLRQIDLAAATEVLLTDETISKFRSNYLEVIGTPGDDPVYEAVSAGRKHAGMEHWLPLFYDRADSIFDFAGAALFFAEHLTDSAADERFASITDYYEARAEDVTDRKPRNSEFSAPAYRPLQPDSLYLSSDEWKAKLAASDLRTLSPFSPPEGKRAYSFGAKVGRTFAAERAAEKVNVFDAVNDYARALLVDGKRVLLACWSQGSADRMGAVLTDHGVKKVTHYEDWNAALNDNNKAVGTIVLGLESGFVTPDAAFISEQDILGDRLVRRGRKKRAENFLTEASSLLVGDLIVHVDHGVGRYAGLKTLDVQGAPHDCLQLEYAGGDKLFLPVENIELLSRFGSDDPNAQLDRLGGAGWQGRKAKMRARIKMLAEQLIAIAAKREMKTTDEIAAPTGAYDEFSARFPYSETEDQENAIADVIEDLARGRPMDRLICGDVGFGKTEVALRAAFVVAMTGRQVAVIAPTTLLTRQHFKNFLERFKGYPLKIATLSRFVSSADAREDSRGARKWRCRHRRRHACASRQDDQVSRSRITCH